MKMIVEIFTYEDRLVYLKKNLGDKVVVLSEPDEGGQLKISVELGGAIDVMELFHAGVKYGLDKMQEVYINK
jgi:predicted component of type VI protein secretion system